MMIDLDVFENAVSTPVSQAEFDKWNEEIRTRLMAQSAVWQKRGLPGIAGEGKLLRPLVAFCTAGAMSRALLDDDRFWDAVLAVQMVHEASLLHDDIIDQADTRRGCPTLVAERGSAVALVVGDHLLTSAYRLIAQARHPELFLRFCEAVEQTVAGEMEQAATRDKLLTSYAYTSMISKKSGALFAFSMVIAPLLLDSPKADALWICGLRLGCQYQRLDDLLDYCPSTPTGKPPFQDYHQKKPTWPWLDLPVPDWNLSEDELATVFFAPIHGQKGAAPRSLGRILSEQFSDFGGLLCEELDWHLGKGVTPLIKVLHDWELRASVAISTEEKAWEGRAQGKGGGALFDAPTQTNADATPSKEPGQTSSEDSDQMPIDSAPSFVGIDASHADDADVPDESDEETRNALTATLASLMAEEGLANPDRWGDYFAAKSRSFSFAARWFPPEQRGQIAGMYAFCRCTDEIADGFGDLSLHRRLSLLRAWEELTRQAYAGEVTGLPLLDRVMPEMAEANVPLQIALDLIEGMQMDLRSEPCHTMEDLLRYCYCAASTVGLWCTHLFAGDDPWVLSRAESLGKAMQLTNILRDVGEDLANGRIYLPASLMQAHGLTEATLWQMKQGEMPILRRYVDMIEALMQEAEALYALSFEGMARLPVFFARPVAVAAQVYRGIHNEIRNNRYNNLDKRAHTSTLMKCWLAPQGLWKLRKAREHLASQQPMLRAAGGTLPALGLASSLLLDPPVSSAPPVSEQ